MPGWATEAYRCYDEKGRVVYSNNLQSGICETIKPEVKPVDAAVDSERFIAPKSAGQAKRTSSSSRRSNTAKSTRSKTGTAASRSTAASPNRIAPQTQMTRDQKRRAILEEELAIEQSNLLNAQARQAQMEAAAKKTGRVTPQLTAQRQQVVSHRKNIDAIQRELARIPK